MKDLWLIDVLEHSDIRAQISLWRQRWRRGAQKAISVREDDNQILAEYADLRDQVKKTADLSWDDDDYWQGLEAKIMAKVEETDFAAEWTPAPIKPKLQLKFTAMPFLALGFCSLLATAGSIVAVPTNSPDFGAQLSQSSQKIDDSQYVLSHQDSNDFLMDVAARRSDPVVKKVVR